MRTIVLALGNPLRGDDGAGSAVIESLLGLANVQELSDIVDGGTPGLETVLLMQGYDRAIIVDAADMGLQPGDWERFEYGDAVLRSGELLHSGTLHSAGLAEALILGEALNILPESIAVYGIQPETIGWEAGLSSPVAAAVPAVCTAIVEELVGSPL